MKYFLLKRRKFTALLTAVCLLAATFAPFYATADTSKSNNGIVSNFDDVNGRIETAHDGSYQIVSGGGNSVSGNSAEIKIHRPTSIQDWEGKEYHFYAADENFKWYGDGVKFWVKGTGLASLSVHTTDGKWFAAQGCYDGINLASEEGKYFELSYSALIGTSAPTFGTDTSDKMTEEDVGKIDFLCIISNKWNNDETTLYIDDITIINPYTPDSGEDSGNNGIVSNFDDVNGRIETAHDGSYQIVSGGGNSVSGNSAEIKIHRPTSIQDWEGKEYHFYAADENFKWYGDGVKFWVKGTGLASLSVHTTDGKWFAAQGCYDGINLASEEGKYFELSYSALIGTSAPTFGTDTSDKMTEEDVGKIDFLCIISNKWNHDETTLYIDDITIINPYTPDSGEDGGDDPQDPEDILSTVNVNDITLRDGDHFTMSKQDGTLTLTLKDDSIYADGASVKDTLEITVPDIKTVIANRETAYMLFDISVPRATAFEFAFVTGDGSVRYKKVNGCMQNVTENGGYVTVKIPVSAFNIGMSAVNRLASLEMTVAEDYLAPYNFLYAGESFSIRNIRFVKDAPTVGYTFAQVGPLEKAPLTSEEIEAQESAKLYSTKEFGSGIYYDAFDQWNNPTYGSTVGLTVDKVEKTSSYYKYFNKYVNFTMLNQDVFYRNSEISQGFKITTYSSDDVEVSNPENYLETATVRFWASASKDMTVYVSVLDATTWGTLRYPVELKATAADEFKQYEFKLKDMYNWAVENEPEALYTVSLRYVGRLCVNAVDNSPEGFLSNDESLKIAGLYMWSKEGKDVNPNDASGLTFHASENGVTVDGYGKVIPSDAVARISDLTDEIGEYSPIFGSKAKIVSLKSVYIYAAEGGRVSPTGRFWVGLDIPENTDVNDLTMFHISMDGSVTELRVVVEGNRISTYTYDMGIYALVSGEVDYSNKIINSNNNNITTDGSENLNSTDRDDNSDDTPNTGENNLVTAAFVLLTASLLGCIVFVFFRKKKYFLTDINNH